MATASIKKSKSVVYPTSDGKPMAETEWHRILMIALIDMLQWWYADVPNVCVSGNLLMYYVPGDKRKHVSPDVFVAFGVPKRIRDYYLTWEEKKNPSVIFELTSSSTRSEDIKKKFVLYRDTLKVKEYFLFDPRGDYLEPRLRGFRLRAGEYEPIELVNGRMPSKQLGLHLETDGRNLRLYDPATETYIPTRDELLETQEELTEQEKQRADQAARQNQALAEENARLREQLQRALQGKKNGHTTNSE